MGNIFLRDKYLISVAIRSEGPLQGQGRRPCKQGKALLINQL